MDRLLTPDELEALLDAWVDNRWDEEKASETIAKAQDAKTARLVAAKIFEELDRGNLVAPEVSLQRAYKALKAKYGL